MKTICAIGIAALTMACGASESHNSSESGATKHAGVAERGSHNVVLNGCLQNADRSDAARSQPVGSGGNGSAGKAVDELAAGRGSPGERFTLTHATSGSPATDPSKGSYVLEGNMEALRAHVNKQVRLMGTLDDYSANNGGSQRVRVQSVEPIADRCRQ
ncbi:MAG: hypothetical protein JWL71_2345 [Acidobacteria bacterium]|nr:hypothetical protein [Acidobacteriota bacterium]